MKFNEIDNTPVAVLVWQHGQPYRHALAKMPMSDDHHVQQDRQEDKPAEGVQWPLD